MYKYVCDCYKIVISATCCTQISVVAFLLSANIVQRLYRTYMTYIGTYTHICYTHTNVNRSARRAMNSKKKKRNQQHCCKHSLTQFYSILPHGHTTHHHLIATVWNLCMYIISAISFFISYK